MKPGAMDIMWFTIACLWPALFLLSWRDGRRKPGIRKRKSSTLHSEGVETSTIRPSRRILKIVVVMLLFAVNGIVIVVFWPAVVGHVLGKMTRRAAD